MFRSLCALQTSHGSTASRINLVEPLPPVAVAGELTVDAKPSDLFPSSRQRLGDHIPPPDVLAFPHIQVVHAAIRIGYPDLIPVRRQVELVEERIVVGRGKDLGRCRCC